MILNLSLIVEGHGNWGSAISSVCLVVISVRRWQDSRPAIYN
jgi:glycerol-3-phosphate dehydrogenase